MNEVQWTPDKVSRFWDYYAQNLSQKEYFGFHSGKYIFSTIKRWLKFSLISSVLDFGCGPGYLLQHLGDFKNLNFYGLDFSQKSVEEVEKKFKSYANFGGAVCVKSLPSSLPSGSIELITSVEVIEHLYDKELQEMIEEIKRLLKPGGYVAITTPNQENLEENKTICPECGCVFHRWQHVRSWDARKLDHVMRQNGFTTIVVSSIVFGSPLKKVYYWMRRNIGKNLFYPHLIYIGRK